MLNIQKIFYISDKIYLRCFANLLNCLAIFDSIFLTCIILQYSLPTLSEHYLVPKKVQLVSLYFIISTISSQITM